MKKYLLLIAFLYSLFFTCFAQGAWTQKVNLTGVGRTDAVGFSIGSKGYIGFGSDGDMIIYNDFWEYDTGTDTWTQKASFNGVARKNAVGFSIGTKGYIGTGYDTTYTLKNDFWEWNQGTNTWTQKANFGGVVRSNAIGFSIGGKGYIGTGVDSNGIFLGDMWEWDQSINTWTQKASIPDTARGDAVGFSVGSKGYVGSGSWYSNPVFAYFNDFWEFDPVADTWTQKADLPAVARSLATGFSLGSKGYIGMGYNMNFLNDFWQWDQSTNIWTQIANFGGIARTNAVGFPIGSKGYIGTGCPGSFSPCGGMADLWEFDPNGVIGITETELENLISIYPNPVRDEIFIQTTNAKRFIVRITTPLGQKVAEKTFQKKTEVDVSSFGKGLFLVEVCAPSPSGRDGEGLCHTEKVLIE